MATITLEHVTYRYGVGTPFEKTALKDINITFAPQRMTGIIGHTGSGKSTLAQILNGLLAPTEGRMLWDGREVGADAKERVAMRYRTGLVFQYPEYQLFEESVEKDIAFGPKNKKLLPDEIERLVLESARFCGVEESLLKVSPFDLSGGQKRRVAIAGILAMDPDVIVLDEPAAGLDPVGKNEILSRLKQYQKEKRKTILFISHSMEDIARFADDILVLQHGRVLLHDTVQKVFENAPLLEEAGVLLPEITRLMLRLEKSGIPVRHGVFTPRDAAGEIVRLWEERGSC